MMIARKTKINNFILIAHKNKNSIKVKARFFHFTIVVIWNRAEMEVKFLFLLLIGSSHQGRIHQFTGITCEVQDESVITVEQCNLTFVGRSKDGAINTVGTIPRPIETLFVSIKSTFKKSNGDYQQLYVTPRIEYCGATSGNTFLRTITDQVSVKLPKCPVQGRVELRNWTIDDKFYSIYPSGEYKTFVDLSVTKTGSNFLAITLHATVNSAIKRG